MSDISQVLVALLNGLASGMELFIIAAGLTVIFGVLGVINFAHGSLYMLGAFATYSLLTEIGLLEGQFWLAVIAAAALVGLLGGVIERFLIRFIYDADHITQLLLTFALVLVLDNGAQAIWGGDFYTVGTPAPLDFRVDVFGSAYPVYNLFVIVFGFAVAAGLWYLFERTRLGKSIRAVSQDRETANALGLNVPLLFTGVFVFGSALAGLGGAIAAPTTSIQATMGEDIIIQSFIVIIIGGLGSFPGAFVGSLLLGISDTAVYQVMPEIQPFVPFLLLIAVIIVRPHGIFGEPEQ